MARPVHPNLTDPAWLEHEYVGLGRSTTDIAAELGCTAGTVGRALKRQGIAARPARSALSDLRLADEAWLRGRWSEGRTLAEMATEVGCSEATVRRALSRAGITVFRPATVFDLYPKLGDRDWLLSRYETASASEIAAEVGANHASVLAALRRHGLPVRSAGTPGRPTRTPTSRV